MNKVPFELELKRRGCRWQSHRPSIHLCVCLAWALTLFQGAPTSVFRANAVNEEDPERDRATQV